MYGTLVLMNSERYPNYLNSERYPNYLINTRACNTRCAVYYHIYLDTAIFSPAPTIQGARLIQGIRVVVSLNVLAKKYKHFGK